MHGQVDFAKLFEASPNNYLVLAPDFTVLSANHAYLKGSGRRLETMIGRSVLALLSVEPNFAIRLMRDDLARSLETVVKTGRSSTVAVTGVSKEMGPGVPRDRYWSLTHTPILGDDGKVELILQHVVEVTELEHPVHSPVAGTDRMRQEASVLGRAREVQEANRALYAEQLHLLRLFDEAPGFICFLRGADHRFELVNRAFSALVGNRDLLTAPFALALPELAGQGLHELLDRVYASGQPYRVDGLQLFIGRDATAQPQRVYLNLILQPITELDASVSGILVQGTDVTAQLEAELEVQRYREHLEELVAERTRALQKSEAERTRAEEALFQAQKLDALGKLTGGVAHDFNNVLQLIAGNLQLLAREADAPRLQTRVNSALAAVEKGGRLAQQLLTFARRQPLAPQVVDLRQLISGMRELLEQAVGPDIRLSMALGEGPATVKLDPFQFETMLINLAVNARDAIVERRVVDLREGVVEVALELVAATAGPGQGLAAAGLDALVLRVRDNGCGMPASVRQQAFEPFFTTKERAGTGLGLSLVYGFVRQSGGRIELDSTEGMGTTVTVIVPLCQAALAEVAAARPAVVGGRGETILLVEPDQSVRAITAELLLDLGYRVVACRDCDEAWSCLVGELQVDVLMTALVGRGSLTPQALLAQVRGHWPALPVILLVPEIEFARTQPEPATVRLAKPFGLHGLARTVQQALQRRPMLMVGETRQQTMESTMSDHRDRDDSSRNRVLLVEDDASLRSLTAECLTQLGCDVTACATAAEAMAQAGTGEFDLLFADVNLKGGSGIELARELSAHNPQLRVVLASGESGLDPQLERATFLHKPYDLKQLQSLLAEPAAS